VALAEVENLSFPSVPVNTARGQASRPKRENDAHMQLSFALDLTISATVLVADC
jgi:hypothetical protein